MLISTIGLVLQAETAISAVPELDYDALATELDMKSPLEIMDHVRLQILPTASCISLTYRGLLARGLKRAIQHPMGSPNVRQHSNAWLTRGVQSPAGSKDIR